jgi:hypothetical protein
MPAPRYAKLTESIKKLKKEKDTIEVHGRGYRDVFNAMK